MASASMQRFGGNALLGGGILWVACMFLHANASTLEFASAANVSLWIAVHWAYLIGDVLLIAGLFLFVRYVAVKGSASNVGWATVAAAGGVLAFTLDAASTGIHLFSFPPVLTAATAPNLQGIYEFAGAVQSGLAGAAYYLASLSLLVLGIALLKEGWSSAVAYGAIAVGGLELALYLLLITTGFALIPAGMMLTAVNALMPACYAVVGIAFSGQGSAAAGASGT